MRKYKVIGIMSGTSLDGLDLAYCEFERKGGKWSYEIAVAETLKYSREWKEKLTAAFDQPKKAVSKLDKEYGRFIGKKVRDFISKNQMNPDFVSSHGHTVFHQPEKKFTLQIGDGKEIAKVCGLTVVNDFRSLDVKLGGQGAPLVPIGDKLLFSEHHFCINLGGFANISFEENKKRIAFDICPVNIVLNKLSKRVGKEFDRNGKISATGKINTALLEKLNALSFYHYPPPKSLGKEWVEKKFNSILNSFDIPVKDKLRTVCEHIALQIALVVNPRLPAELLITGGGAYNKFLINLISEKSKCSIIIPDKKTIEFKEALIFAFLGVLRMRNEINTLRSVTGAKRDSSGGKIYRNKKSR